MYSTHSTIHSSDHKLSDVKQTDRGNVRLRNNIRIKSEIEATCNSPISCLKLAFSALFYNMFGYLII